MTEYKTENVKIPFKVFDGTYHSADLFLHTLNSGSKSVSNFGPNSYYDCLDFRNAWRKRLKRGIEGYYNRGQEGEFEGLSLEELKYQAFIRGREIAQKIISNIINLTENIVLFLPPNSLGEAARLGKKNVLRNASEHMGSWIGFGVQAFLEIEGYSCVTFRHETLTELSEPEVKQIPESFRIIIIDDTILKGDTLYKKILPDVIKFLIALSKDDFRIDFFSYFSLTEGIINLRSKNGWTRYGFQAKNFRKERALNLNIRVTEDMYAKIINKMVDEELWTQNELEMLIQCGYM